MTSTPKVKQGMKSCCLQTITFNNFKAVSELPMYTGIVNTINIKKGFQCSPALQPAMTYDY